MKLEQAPQISVQMLKALQGHDGPITINFNMSAVQNGIEVNESDETKAALSKKEATPEPSLKPINDRALIEFIASFPPPRLRNFVTYILALVAKDFKGNRTHAAPWLGVSTRSMRMKLNRKDSAERIDAFFLPGD